MSPIQLAVLRDVYALTTIDIRTIHEPYRQRLIDLAMMEPALVDIDADQVFITEAGRLALSKEGEAS